jgi:hypothetical protein
MLVENPSMLLLKKGQAPKPICAVCRKLFSGKRCPKCESRRIAAAKHADKVYRELLTLRESRVV